MSDPWWGTARALFDKVAVALKHAKEGDLKTTGHDCGHRFRITVSTAGHYGIVGEGPEAHQDFEDYDDDLVWNLEVRAHDLPAAMMLAAATPLSQWHGPLSGEEDSCTTP